MSLADDETRRGLDPDAESVAKLFEQFYTPHALYIREAQQTGPQSARVTSTIKESQCDPRMRTMLLGTVTRNLDIITNRKLITPDIPEGHLVIGQLLAGYQGTGMILEGAQVDTPYWLRSFQLVRFGAPIIPGQVAEAETIFDEKTPDGAIVSGTVTRVGGTVAHTRANGLALERADTPHPEGTLPQHHLLEVGAQMGGAAAILSGHKPKEGYGPIFVKVRKGTLQKVHIRPEDILAGHARVLGVDSQGVITTSVTILRGDEEVADFPEISFAFADIVALLAKLKGENPS